MPELIEFAEDWFAEVQDAGTPGRLRQVAFRRRTRLLVEVHRVDNASGTVEVADLRLADGTTALGVPLLRFAVVWEQARAA